VYQGCADSKDESTGNNEEVAPPSAMKIKLMGGEDPATFMGSEGDPRGYVAIHRWFGTDKTEAMAEGGRPDKRDDSSNYVFVHTGEAQATRFEKIDVDDDTFIIKMTGGDDTAQWEGAEGCAYLACQQFFENDARDDCSCWLFAHVEEKNAAVFKLHECDGGFKLQMVGVKGEGEPSFNDGSGWVVCHRFDGCADKRDECSNYMAVHKEEGPASIWKVEE